MRVSLHLPRAISLLLALFCSALAANAQVVSIFLSYHGGPNATFMEADQDITFDVVTPSHTGVQTLDYRVVSGTAEDGKDFIGSSGTLVFAPDENFKPLTVHLIDDKLFEGNEQFYIELSNPVPMQFIASPRTAITIRDNDSGYATDSVSAKENDGFVEIPVHRRGDIDFVSSVEVYLEPETAQPGVDYVDASFTVTFGPGETLKTVRVGLINNTIEDGPRYIWVKLRNPTAGVPIGFPSSEVTIEDNEVGYGFRVPDGASDLALYEGGPEPLILERRGDYNVRSVATVRVSPFGGFVDSVYRPPATEGADFVGTEFQVEFAPGQKSAEVPLIIVNDNVPELSKWIRLQYTSNLTDSAMAERLAVIRDNEFNPLPITRFCVEANPGTVVLSPTALRDGKFLVTSGSDYYGESNFNYTIRGYTEAAEPDAAFAAIQITDGRPGKIFEGADGKLTILIARANDVRLLRYQANGQTDSSFTPVTRDHISDFAFLHDGRIYLSSPLERVNADGTADASFFFANLGGGGGHLTVDAQENVYVTSPGSNWMRVTPAGTIDPTFSCTWMTYLLQIGGVMYRSDSTTQRLLANGQSDPAFTPITNGWVQAAPGGKLYNFGWNGAESFVERYHADGTLDTNYTRGVLDTALDLYDGRASPSADHRSLLINFPYAQSVNGVSLVCGGASALAQINLDVPMGRILVEPNKNRLREKETGEGKVLTFIRTGDNASPSTVKYRVRPDSALPGEHYNIAAEGEFQFGAGLSRALVPISIIDNDKPELDRNFFVDLLSDTGETLSTAQFTIVNDDVGINILSRGGNKLTLLPISGEYPYLHVQQSADLRSWQTLGAASNGVPFDVETSGDSSFFLGFGYRGY